jgi:hypothetical protein
MPTLVLTFIYIQLHVNLGTFDAVPVPSLEGFMLKLTQRGTRDTQQLQASNSQLQTLTRPLYAVQCSSDNMPSPLSRFEPDASSRSRLVLPALLFLASLVANVASTTKHSLLTSALAWLAICALCTFKTGAKNLLDVTPAKKNTWAAGLLFALAQVCDKAVDGRAIWWAKVRQHSGGLD